MNILQIRGEFTDNGPGSQTLSISEELRRRGHKVVFCSGGGKLTNKIKLQGFKYFISYSLSYENRNLVNVLRSFLFILKILKRESIDIVHAHNAAIAAISWMASKFVSKKIKIFQSVRGIEIRNNYRWRNFIYRLNFYDELFAVCEKGKDLLKEFGVKDHKIKVTYNGTDLKKFNLQKKDIYRKQIREEFNISFDSIVIGIIGKQDGFKGHKILIKVFSKLLEKYKNIHLILVGEGKELKENKQLVSDLRLENKITFTGLRLDPERLHAAFDIFALLSKKNYEMFPNAIIESLSYGNCFVATNTQGVSETARGGSGIICECGDFLGFENAFIKLIENKSLREEMGQAGLKSVKEVFNIFEVVNKIEGSYLRIK